MQGFETWQIALGIVGALAFVVLCAVIGREMYFAVNPDKRPRKRRRHPRQ